MSHSSVVDTVTPAVGVAVSLIDSTTAPLGDHQPADNCKIEPDVKSKIEPDDVSDFEFLDASQGSFLLFSLPLASLILG